MLSDFCDQALFGDESSRIGAVFFGLIHFWYFAGDSHFSRRCIIGVGQHYDIFFGTEKYRSNPNKVPAKGCIRYEGNGLTYESDFEINLESYATIFSVTTEQEKLRNKLEKQCSALKGIQKELHELNAQIQKKNSDEMENKE